MNMRLYGPELRLSQELYGAARVDAGGRAW
jgi:hypothetical protein